ncbi:MAG: hypothetical protein KDA86_25875 [Planctomycetaceae bacterium]|nr:hypothetical protein [Planctomycetaceae bacterium]
MLWHRMWLVFVCVCGLCISSAAGEDASGRVYLLHASQGQIPNDTGMEDQTKLSSVNVPELKGKAVKVPLAAEDSFGVRSSAVTDWTGYLRLRMDAFNPNPQTIELELNVIHSESTNYDTRVVAPLELPPGKSELSIEIAGLTNTNGSHPNLSEVTKWYIADSNQLTKTFYVGDIWLESADSVATGDMPAEPAFAPPVEVLSGPQFNSGFRVRGRIGTADVDLIITPLSIGEGEPLPHNSSDSIPSDGILPRDVSRRATNAGAAGRFFSSHPVPEIVRPISFETPEADAIASAIEIFPADSPLKQNIADWPLHPNSDGILASIGLDKPLRYNTDMAYVFVPPTQQKVPVRVIEIPDESDSGPFPIPDNLPIELWPVHYQREGIPITLDELQRGVGDQGDDRHAIIIAPTERKLYEFWHMKKTPAGWQADQASIFDLSSNGPFRPDGWTSADASGMPIFPLVVRHDELQRGVIEHALRVTVSRTRQAYVYPATHYASQFSDADLPRMGERIRLRADYDSSLHSPPVQIILAAMKTYGLLVADNGIDWAVSVAADPRIPNLHSELRKIQGSDFEVIVAPEDYRPPQ